MLQVLVASPHNYFQWCSGPYAKASATACEPHNHKLNALIPFNDVLLSLLR